MTEKKCVLRPALWAFALAGSFAIAVNVASAAGNRVAAEVAVAADAAASSDAAKSDAVNPDGSRTWNFDHDRGYSKPQDWTAVAGDWRVIIDSDAPSEPNTMGLPGYGLPHTKTVKLWFDSFFNDNYLLAIPKNTPEYTDFSYQAAFKPWGGAWGSYAGLVFRYSDPRTTTCLSPHAPRTLCRCIG